MTSHSCYAILWEFRVRPGAEAAFERAYGPDGDWVQFFRRGEGYLGTESHRDATDPRRYLTVDYWASQPAYEAFRQRWASDYQALDARCESLTEQETPLGAFFCQGRMNPPA